MFFPIMKSFNIIHKRTNNQHITIPDNKKLPDIFSNDKLPSVFADNLNTTTDIAKSF